MRLNSVAALAAAAGLCLLAVGVSIADVREPIGKATRYTARRGSSNLASPRPASLAECRTTVEAAIEAEGQTRTTGSITYQCITTESWMVHFRPAPTAPTCDPTPADRRIDCPTGYTGTWTQRAEVSPTCDITWSPIAFPPDACTVVSQPPAERPLFIDRFEYDVSRSATNAEQLFRGSGWSGVKAENSVYGRGDGWAYTRQDATLGSRVLVLEAHPAPITGFPDRQTDFWVQLGNESSSTAVIPANAWIQFWTYATPESRFDTRDKTIYPCRGAYPCHPTWLFMWGAQGFESTSAPAGGRYLALEGQGAIRDTRHTGNGDDWKLYQNASRTPLLAGRWYQVRLHMDISGAQGVYEAWIKERGQTSFTKVADWHSATPNFTWPISNRTGYNIVRIPTTVNNESNTVYIDDFVIAESADALPN